MNDARETELRLYLRPIELALLLVEAKRRADRAYDPLNQESDERRVWDRIAKAAFDALRPEGKPV